MSDLQIEISLRKRLESTVNELAPELINLRRALHENPELSHQEKETAGRLHAFLSAAGYEVHGGIGGHGLVCEAGPASARSTIGLRADMDALPVEELTGLSFSSKNTGTMHACGHDVHAAIVAGTAVVLKKVETELPFRVRFIFQPAEESSDSGAVKFIASGVADGLSALFGIHVDPSLEFGLYGLKAGPMMASIDFINIDIVGRGGHGAEPDRTVDPIRVATKLLGNMYELAREFAGRDKVILSFGQINAGTVNNIIPDRCLIKGTFRTFDENDRNRFRESIIERAKAIAATTGSQINVGIIPDAPPVINDANLGAPVECAIMSVLGPQAVRHVQPMNASEDFAFYAAKAPIYFLRLGTASDEDTRYDLHNARFAVDERIIPQTVRILSVLPFCINPAG